MQETFSPEKLKLFERLLKQKGIVAPGYEAILRREKADFYPLSFAQRRLWFLDQFEPDSALYNISLAVSLSGKLDTDALRESFIEIVRRHEILRTTFAVVGDEPMQIIATDLSVALSEVDLSNGNGADVNRIIRSEAQRPFDLSTGPLLRLLLLKVSDVEHILVVTMHHIISDRWSLGVLIREIRELYQARVEGKPSPLPELPIQYADYASWQSQHLNQERLQRQLEYWKEKLASVPTLNLPADHPRPPQQTFRGTSVDLEFDSELTASLRELSRREQVTLFVVLLTAFQILLARYSHQMDIAIGTPVAGRTRSETESLIGVFVNTLVLRTVLAPDLTVRELLSQNRDLTLGAYSHQDIPFEKLVEVLQPERDLSRAPLFQAMLMLQNTPQTEIDLEGLTLRELDNPGNSTKFDLTLMLAEEIDGLRGKLEYNTDLFEQATIARMAGHFEHVLKAMLSAAREIREIDVLSASERYQLLSEWNDTRQLRTGPQLLHKLFEEQVRRRPDAVAVVFEQEQLSYRELNRRANQLARRLSALGIGPEICAGVLLERSSELLIALLGVLKAGGAYLPLDPSYPASRLQFMLCEARVLITQKSLRQLVHETNEKVVLSLDEELDTVCCESGDDLSAEVRDDSLAYVLFTSGSTGQPKGVGVTHGSLLNFLDSMSREPGLVEADRLLAVTPLIFDIAGLELFLPLAVGAKVVVASLETATDGALLCRELGAKEITVMQGTPATWRLLLAGGWEETKKIRIFCGGEALNTELARELSPRSRDFWNLYGPTETTIWSMIWNVAPEADQILIGRPIENTEVYVVDEAQQVLPVGVYGELCIGGAGLARGYVNRPELTAERFVPHPYSLTGGARVYRTGDVVRWNAAGQLEFHGRADHQVKVRGYRIELGEIEAALRSCSGVKQAVVLAREQSLVAYVVGECAVSELRVQLSEKLPQYMVPAVIVELAELPLTANGKLDRRALPEPELSGRQQEYAGPRTPVEELVAGIFAEVLKLERVGRRENFFELGGHSLLATRVVSRVQLAFAVQLPLRTLFEAPTVAALAHRVEEARSAGRYLSVPALRRAERSGRLPLSFAQQRLWFIDQLEPESVAYNIPTAVRLRGNLNVEALRRSFAEIVRRHEVLRTRFVTEAGEPQQVIGAGWEVELPVLELSETAAREWAAREAAQPFVLSEGPLLRLGLARLSEEEHVLAVTMHHIISDGWSVGVLIREVSALYEAYSQGDESPLAELTVQYGDFAVWQREWLQGAVLEQQLGYWREQLAGLVPLELPTDRPRPAVPSHHGAVLPFSFGAELSSELKGLSQRAGVTPFMTLLAGFEVLLARYSGQDQITVGTPVANRTQPLTEGLIGFFVNQLVLRSEVTSELSFSELLKQVRETTLSAYEHQDLPFERLVEELMPERDLSRAPLFQVMLVLQNAPREQLQLGDLELESFAVEARPSKFDMTLFLEEREGHISGELEYASELFDATTMASLLRHYQVLLESALVQPQQALHELPLLSVTEREQVLRNTQGAEREWGATESLTQLLAESAARVPDRIAVVYEDECLSYGELHARAEQVAKNLQLSGVGPDAIVGVCMERSVELVVALLGVLKAGAAYLPLDVNNPTERLRYVCEDAGARVVLTKEHLQSKMKEIGAEVHCVERLMTNSAGWSRSPGVSGENLAYVIYTSGSTGQPKGVMVRQQGLINHMHWMAEEFGLSSEDCILQKTPVSFDASVWEFYAALLYGGRLVLGREGGHQDAGYLVTEMLREGVTLVQVVPTMLQWLVTETGLRECASVRAVFCGGEALRWEAGRLLGEQLGAVEWVNLYGPTEGTIEVTWWRGKAGAGAASAGAVPIGRPIANAEVYVVDEAQQVLPVGVYGELCIGGVGLARGYLNRPELTAERFVPHPYSATGGARLYRTGDVVRWNGEGQLEFRGRADHQVKVRGYRIELGEIEAALRSCSGVKQAVVLAREQGLVGYVVSERAVSSSELRAQLSEKLPQYMVPAVIVELAELPLTASGKLDRKALPEPELKKREHEYSAPRTATEEVLTRIFAEVLQREKVGIHDNFFALGGDSILSIHIGFRARQEGLYFTTQQLFQHQTIAELAPFIETASSTESEQELLTGTFPLTPIQQRFFEQDLAEAHHYNQSILLEVGEKIDPALLKEAFNRLLEHHAVLRLRFRREESGWTQEIAPQNETIPISEVDLSKLSYANLRPAIEATLTDQQATLDLFAGPMIRVTVIKCPAPQPDRLSIICHHLVIDGVSWRILLEDLETAYRHLRRQQAVQLPGTTTSFKRWAQSLFDYAQSPELHEEQDYWVTQSLNITPLLPLDFSAGENIESSTETVLVTLDAEETDALLHEVQSTLRVQINDILLTALAHAFSRWTGERSLLVDLEGHGREPLLATLDLSRTVGWFTNIFPVVLELGDQQEPVAELRSVKEQLRHVPKHGAGYGALRYLTKENTEKQLLEFIQPQVLFNYFGQIDLVLSESSLFRSAAEYQGPQRSLHGRRTYLLEVEVSVVEGRLLSKWIYSRDVHKHGTVQYLAESFLAALRSLIASLHTQSSSNYTPSDFPRMTINQDDLDELLAQVDLSLEDAQ